MATVERTLRTTPDRVWDVLADGWLFAVWVVGASRIREVEDGWPQVGACIHHSVGVWPALIDDTTSVTQCEPGQRLVMRARGWPLGEAQVSLHLEAVGSGTRVVIEEDAVSGPGVLVPTPLRSCGLRWRNAETLRRLAYVAERRG